MKKPFGIIVNRSGLGDNGVYDYIKDNNYCLLTEIPYDQKIAEFYSNGELIVDHLPEVNSLFEKLVNEISNLNFSHFDGNSCN
jgi:MinD superfamily P-loop ATPase